MIDVWLRTTYGEDRVLRDNTAAATRNQPRLAAVLRALAVLVGDTLRVGSVKIYAAAITPTGFDRPVS
jgi:hypothetical protein